MPPVSGRNYMRPCSSGCVSTIKSTGIAPASMGLRFPAPGGPGDRAQPHEPRQARLQASSRRRRAGHPAGGVGQRSQPPRLGDVRAMRRCHACHQRAAGPASPATHQVACGQGLRLLTVPSTPEAAGHHEPNRPARCREQRAPGQALLGHRAHARVVRGLRQAAYSLRAPTRHSSGAALVGRSHHLLAVRRPVVLASLNS